MWKGSVTAFTLERISWISEFLQRAAGIGRKSSNFLSLTDMESISGQATVAKGTSSYTCRRLRFPSAGWKRKRRLFLSWFSRLPRAMVSVKIKTTSMPRLGVERQSWSACLSCSTIGRPSSVCQPRAMFWLTSPKVTKNTVYTINVPAVVLFLLYRALRKGLESSKPISGIWWRSRRVWTSNLIYLFSFY